jgi:hypothetical protein
VVYRILKQILGSLGGEDYYRSADLSGIGHRILDLIAVYIPNLSAGSFVDFNTDRTGIIKGEGDLVSGSQAHATCAGQNQSGPPPVLYGAPQEGNIIRCQIPFV